MARRNLLIEGAPVPVTQAVKRARSILSIPRTIKRGDPDYGFVLWIFQQRRPNLPVTNSLVFKVALGPDECEYNCFWYRYPETDWDAFSYRKAMEAPTQKVNHTSGTVYSKSDILSAFRVSVYEQTKSFREAELKKNPKLAAMSAKRAYDVHTDHVVPMHLLIADFLGDRGMKLKNVPVKKIIWFGVDNYEIDDPKLRRDWINYHRQHAKLKLLTCTENLSKAGSQDVPLYNYKKRRGESYD